MDKTRSPTVIQKNYIQFSKKLATVITVFWCFFRLVCMAAIFFNPAIAAAVQALIQGADDVMMVNIGFYSGNSIAEKGIIGYFGRNQKQDDELEDEQEESLG